MKIKKLTNEKIISNENISELKLLRKIAEAIQDMPFGESIALPWCRESFPKLDQAMKDWERGLY